MNAKPVIVVGFLIAVGAVVALTLAGKKRNAPPEPTAGSTARPSGGAPTDKPSGDRVSITFLYSTEKKDWIETATEAFELENADIDVALVGMGSIEARSDILDGKQKPTIWSPADSLVLRLLDADWATKNGAPLFVDSGDDAPQPLLITPLVFVVWQDRGDVLARAAGGRIGWKSIHKAVSSNRGWPAIGGKRAWGFVKLGHTDPTRSNSGLQALFLMALEAGGKRTLSVGDLLRPNVQTFIRELERGVPQFETSTGTFMTDMIRFGPSKYDIAVVYESLAIGQLENARGRWGNLIVYYPPATIWSDNPAGILAAPWVSDAQRGAARRFLAFLHDTPMQERALLYGFRPADPKVAIRDADPRNPFSRLAPYGIRVDVPPAATLPDAAVVRNLLIMWSRLVRRP